MTEGVVVWVTGPDERIVGGVARAIVDRLARRHVTTELLDARTPGIQALAGPDMDRRAAFAASLLVRHGVTVVAAVPSPSRAARAEIRAALGRMIEVYVPVGVGRSAYEPPERAEVQIDFPESELDAAALRALRTLEVLGYLRPADDPSYSEEEERQVIKRLKSFGYI
ncbi:MAG TPA: adenylyl-sulfate kinase [Candidatus Eisenbacteria bacterium]|nr:adenylyl-sulfate kinase [Candidatus Eisenbacteria bacterium]